MEGHSIVFAGLDVSKNSHSVAMADAAREGEVRFLGDIASSAESVRHMAGHCILAMRQARLVLTFNARSRRLVIAAAWLHHSWCRITYATATILSLDPRQTTAAAGTTSINDP